MIQRLKLWYPFLFALVPILNILTRNPGGSRLDDVAVIMGFALAATALIYLVVALALRGRESRALVPVIVLAVVMLCYGKTALGGLSRQVAGAPPVAVLAGLLLAIALGIWWLARRRRTLERVNRFFALTGL